MTTAVKIRCKVCGDYFYPDEETLALMSDGYLLSGDVNTCDECWEMLNIQSNDDHSNMRNDTDPELKLIILFSMIHPARQYSQEFLFE